LAQGSVRRLVFALGVASPPCNVAAAKLLGRPPVDMVV